MRQKALPDATRRGFAIILVLATLVLLAMLSLTYIKLALIDRNIARNYMDNKRAKLIAQSGVDYAIGRLNNIIHDGWFKNGNFSSTEWIYNYDGAETPSFADSRTIKINGKQEKFSSVFSSSTYGQNSDLFSLKVINTQSQININDGSNISNTHYTSCNLQRILNVLGMQVTPQVTNLGDRIIQNRPAGGYTNKRELIKILGYDDYTRVKDFITTHSWTNDSVCIPVPLSDYSTVVASYPFFNSIARPTDSVTNQKIYRYGHNLNWKGDIISEDSTVFPEEWQRKLIFADPTETSKIHGVYSTDALNPQWIELTQRSPVNINTASAEVLKALIIDLQGFFVMERRTPNPPTGNYRLNITMDAGTYTFTKPKYTYDKNIWDPEGHGYLTDELGFMYKTFPYFGTGGANTSGIDANVVVQEIIACRRREGAYSSVNYGGPFKSWAQFNIFVDKLVENGIIIDDRGYFDIVDRSENKWDILEWGPDLTTYVYTPNFGVPYVPSYVQKRLSSVAAGDVLKANFNPNLHLNELNPDRQLFTMVDKTDLIVNSTEFCFTPMGYFEIESAGYVLLPQETKNSLTASDNFIVANAKINAVTKLFDVYYETSQDRFYQGEFSNRLPAINPRTTNNVYAIETGPEVDNGPAITDTNYDGYIRLSTILGCLSSTKKPKGKLWTTYSDNTTDQKYPDAEPYSFNILDAIGDTFSSANIHSHFQLDHVAHFPTGGTSAGLPMGSEVKNQFSAPTFEPPIKRYNFRDKSETRRGPYSPVDNPSRYRLCRSFRISTGEPPGYLYAPSDLRVDGVYVEPHSAFGYNSVSFTSEAVVSFWIKPNWFPELSGRVKTLTSMRKYMVLASNDKKVEWPLPFEVFFWPCNPASSDLSTNRCLIQAAYCNIWVKDYAVVSTRILNHEFEGNTENWDRFRGYDSGFNYLRNREWTFIIVRFYSTPSSSVIDIYVNNSLSKINILAWGAPPNYSALLGPYIIIGGDFSSYCATNLINIAHLSGTTESYLNRIFYADSTIDEFFFWADQSTNGLTMAQYIWGLGRYYKPRDGDSADAVFTSQEIRFTSENKSLQAESTVAAPGNTGAGSPLTQTENINILGVAWTYYAEDYDVSTEPDGTPRLKPVMWNWKNSTVDPATDSLNTTDAKSLCEARLSVNNVDSEAYDNDGYSAVNMSINQSDIVKYKVKFKIGSAADLNTVLLASPIFDDITIYYTNGAKFLSYSYLN